jgi:NAD(P)-dependent dehydrogenase (short-subunit alcohol dehydrogenase family)
LCEVKQHGQENLGTIQTATKAFLATIPMGRQGMPDDVARVALFLATEASDYITGTTIVVDGGYIVSQHSSVSMSDSLGLRSIILSPNSLD